MGCRVCMDMNSIQVTTRDSVEEVEWLGSTTEGSEDFLEDSKTRIRCDSLSHNALVTKGMTFSSTLRKRETVFTEARSQRLGP